jgi:mercuric ion transport protein
VDTAIKLKAQVETSGAVGKLALIGGALVAALAATGCCIAPLVLVLLGLGGAWMADLSLLAPYRWVFILAALGFMGLAWHKIYRAAPATAQCEPGTLCALPQTNRKYRVMFWVVSPLVLLALVSPYVVAWFV